MKLWTPTYHTHIDDWRGHATFAKWLVEKARPHTIVELGVRYGDSLFTFAEAMELSPTSSYTKRLKERRKVIGIDIWDSNGQFTDFPEVSKLPLGEADAYGIVQAHARHVTATTSVDVELMKMYTTAAAPLLAAKDTLIDILHVDASHTYRDVKKDFEAFVPMVAPTGIVLFHDSCSVLSSFGVGAYLHELKKNYPILTFTHSEGLSVLFMPRAYYMIPEIDKFKEQWLS